MLNGLFRALVSGNQGPPESPFQQFPSTSDRPNVLVTLLAAEPASVTSAIRRHGNQTSHRAVFVVTDPDVHVLRSHEVIFEYLPSPEIVRRFASSGDWAGYLTERWKMLNAKWTPNWVADHGVNFKDYLLECQVSDSFGRSK